MTDNTMPYCLCNQEDLSACDWEVQVVQTIKRAGDGGRVINVTTSVSPGMSVIEALNLGLHQVNGTTSGAAGAAIAELKACLGADSPQVVMAETMLDQ